MAHWIEGPCLDILKKLNQVSDDDDREAKQLSILKEGLADINKEMMRRAAKNTRAQFGEVSEEKAEKPKPESKQDVEEKSETQEALEDTPDLDDFDSFDEELDMIEQTLIRSIGD